MIVVLMECCDTGEGKDKASFLRLKSYLQVYRLGLG